MPANVLVTFDRVWLVSTLKTWRVRAACDRVRVFFPFAENRVVMAQQVQLQEEKPLHTCLCFSVASVRLRSRHTGKAEKHGEQFEMRAKLFLIFHFSWYYRRDFPRAHLCSLKVLFSSTGWGYTGVLTVLYCMDQYPVLVSLKVYKSLCNAYDKMTLSCFMFLFS